VNAISTLMCFDKKFLIRNLVARNLKIKYRESVLGYLWTMAIPACQIAIFYVLYMVIFKVTVPHYLLFLISGLLPWLFFSTTLSESMESISGNSALLNQMPIPIQAFPNTSAITNMTNLLASLPIAAIVFAASGIAVHSQLLLIIPLVAIFYFQALALGVIFSILYVYFRDLRHVTGLILQIWMYATPIVYAPSMVPERAAKYLFYGNPVAGFFIAFRQTIFNETLDLNYLAAFCGWTLFLMAAALLILHKMGSGVVERL